MRFLIAHAAWRPERRASLGRLLEQLDGENVAQYLVGSKHATIRRLASTSTVEVLSSLGREHAAIWARRIWEAAADHDEHVCILNDDVILGPDFRAVLERMVAAVPDEPLSLHCTNPAVLPYAAQGHPWVRCYHYTGPAVVLPPGAAEDLLSFVYRQPWSLLSSVNEDVVASMWAWDRQRPFWYALPSPVTHDTSVPSTLGYDDHPHRVPVVLDGPVPDPTVRNRWRVPFVELSWLPTGNPKHGLYYKRDVLRWGRHLCAFCHEREGEIGLKYTDTRACRWCVVGHYDGEDELDAVGGMAGAVVSALRGRT